MSNENTAMFKVDVAGEVTGSKWYGQFKVKIHLSHREQLQRDKIRRELLGADPEGADVKSRNQAEIFSSLAVRVVESPPWWAASGNGLDLLDDNVVIEVYEKTMKAELDVLTAMKEKAAQAKKDLEKVEPPKDE